MSNVSSHTYNELMRFKIPILGFANYFRGLGSAWAPSFNSPINRVRDGLILVNVRSQNW